MEELLYSIFDQQLAPAVWQRFGSALLLIIVCAAALVAVCVYLWHLKEKRDECIFTITRESIGEQSEQIQRLLTQMKASRREITTALLLLEEIVVRLHEHMGQAVTARVSKFLGDIQISLSAAGEEYNPFESLAHWDSESEDYLRDIIFRANKANLSYSRHGGKNFITIRAHQAASRALYYTFGAMVLGIATGFLMKLLPADIAGYIADNIILSIQTVFMNMLFLLTAPIAFFSITSSLAGFSGGDEIRRKGDRAVGLFVFVSVIAILVGFCMAALFFRDGLMPVIEAVAFPLEEIKERGRSVADILSDVIPINVFMPVLNGNMMQLLLVSLLIGMAMSALGEKVGAARELCENGKLIFSVLMEKLMLFMPAVAFAAFALFVYRDADMLGVLLLYVAAVLAGCVVIFCVQLLLVAFAARVSPVPLLKKLPQYMLTPFTVSERYSIIPQTVDFCSKKLGVPNQTAAFSASLGAAVNIAADAMCVIVQTMLLSRLCGIQLSAAVLAKIGFTTLLVSFGSNGFVCLMAVLPIAGVPIGLSTLVIGIEAILDRFRTVCNTSGDIAASVVVAKSEDQLNMAVYKA